MRYFVLSDTGPMSERWYLKGPYSSGGEAIDPWQFTAGRFIECGEPLIFRKHQQGRVVPFTFAACEIPVVDHATGHVFRTMCADEVQLIPARVEDEPREFWVLNATIAIAAVDEEHSDFTRFSSEDGPDLAGRYEMFLRLRVDKSKVAAHQIFRLRGWEAPLIVSEKVREALLPRSLPGLLFEEV